MASRLEHEYIRAPNVLLNLNIGLAVAEARNHRLPARQPEEGTDFVAQRFVSRATEDLELIVHPGALGLALRFLVGVHLGLLFGRCRKSSHRVSL